MNSVLASALPVNNTGKINDRKIPHNDLAGIFRIVGCSDSAISNRDINIDLRADGKAALVYRVGTGDLQTALSSQLPYHILGIFDVLSSHQLAKSGCLNIAEVQDTLTRVGFLSNALTKA